MIAQSCDGHCFGPSLTMTSWFSLIIQLFAGCLSSKLELWRIPPGSKELTFIQQTGEFEDNFWLCDKAEGWNGR